MADLNIASTNGVTEVTSTGGSLIATTTAKGIAGGTILPGQVVYADPSVGNRIKLAVASDPFQASHVVGIALGSASPNQPIVYATAGDIGLSTSGAGSILTSGVVYALSASAGGGSIAPITDNPASVAVLGIGNGGTVAGNASYLRLSIEPAPVVQ